LKLLLVNYGITKGRDVLPLKLFFTNNSSIDIKQGYRYVNMHINSINDTSISCKSFVNFGPITPELTELICELTVRHGKYRCILPNISGYAGPIFTNFSPNESILGADDQSGPLIPISHGTLP